MPLELNFKILDEITDEKILYKKALASCKKYLKNWWQEDEAGFCETMRADLETVFETYQFEKAFYSLNRDKFNDESLYYLANTIRIKDDEYDDVIDYEVRFDNKLNIISEVLK